MLIIDVETTINLTEITTTSASAKKRIVCILGLITNRNNTLDRHDFPMYVYMPTVTDKQINRNLIVGNVLPNEIFDTYAVKRVSVCVFS